MESRPYLGERHATADFTEADDDDDDSVGEDDIGLYQDDPADEDGTQRAPILPLFSATYLVSQFLIKPMQQQIRAHHFSRATVYCLMANCLQFSKEGQMYPGNAGTSSTRAKVCELLALKLLREYSTRELIDVLSYDFYPPRPTGAPAGSGLGRVDSKLGVKAAIGRTSSLEVAIRASAKHFLAHPLVVQHLEAIWNGAISFYSAADSLHRDSVTNQALPDSKRPSGKSDVRTPLLGSQSSKDDRKDHHVGRRTVTLYDPRNASSLNSPGFASPAVLSRRSTRITTLELVFWFWSAGFMLDELVGFNEQGFSLYIMSFWNIFDLGILILLIVYYCMRGYGVFLVDPHHWNQMAVLDHYPYFSQLLIAFRLMAVDLAAVTVLVLISCSGFFILMGFTPAAWQVFLFAINTISMVKNDALFSYIAPTNIFAWLLMPLRYCMPLRHFVWLNRLVIKATHFPLLFCIFLYERYWLASSMFEPTDLVENPGQSRPRTISFADPASRTAVFSPNVRVREESIVGFQKDHALEEVFRRVPGITTLRSQRRIERRKTQNAIRTWMDQHDEEGTSPANWPTLDSRARGPEWSRRFSLGRDLPHRLRQVSDVRSAASDPADLISNSGMGTFARSAYRPRMRALNPEPRDLTDADGDDELVTNDEEEEENATNVGGTRGSSSAELDRSPLSRQALNRNVDLDSFAPPETRSPRRSLYMASRSRPVVSQRTSVQPTTPRAIPRLADPISRLTQGRRLSSIDTGPGSENTNLLIDDPNIGDVPGSFQTQMAMAMMKQGAQPPRQPIEIEWGG
ncbi:unnamed protein product [Parascedosporium putredinis]|uniref:Ion transport domain-containing protein n=1 Tax=Parascedosporium putredinis TaxID=1442378 RepID=A0A9P1GUL3_9PEZI|nr:unnamed protein product [Parascedosporium putredinis]CAI7987937.1 unnamed protein product [Parascedosporium putredinis]